MHNRALGILLWPWFCHRIEKQNSESFLNYDADLTSVITMKLKFFFFAMLFSLHDAISYDVINIKNFREILRYFFQILVTPLLSYKQNYSKDCFLDLCSCIFKKSQHKNLLTIIK